MEKRIMSDGLLGPLARNIISLWYLGIWNELPWYWWLQHGIGATNETRVVSSEAYKEGLLWRAMGAHPPGAKQPGYGSWSLPPQIEAV